MKGLCGVNCSKCLIRSYCGGCSMCEASLCNKKCESCFSLCPERKGLFFHLNSIGGLDLDPESNLSTHFILPIHIPIVPDKVKTKITKEKLPVVSIHAGKMFSRNGVKINKSYLNKGFQHALNLDKYTKGILEFYVKDRTLEGFWDNRHFIYSGLKQMGFKAIISPNFSVYSDAPRMDHLYNMKRSEIVYNEMINEGLEVIPDISWYNKIDLDRWCKAITKNNIKTIAFSFQVVGVRLKASTVWKSFILGFRYLCENIPRDVSIVVAGIVSKKRVEKLFQASNGQSIHILNQSAYVQSRRAVISETRKQNKKLTFDEIFLKNKDYFDKTYTELKGKYNP
ncbi:MAG: DUF4417 domain-containing protein [Firmicutes bacterium]|nr:DUF4417 domain-containing protein [Bacillota bacterium]